MRGKYIETRFIPSSFLHLFDNHDIGGCAVLVLAFVRPPSGMSTGLSETLEMFLGSPTDPLLTPSSQPQGSDSV